MAEMYTAAFLAALETGLRDLVTAWGLPQGTPVTLLNISENATYRADPPGRAPVILRVHRPDYHSPGEILSELAWIDALRTAEIAPVPAPLDLLDGGRIARMEVAGALRHVVAFAFVPGHEPNPSDDGLARRFHQLGAISARLHRHARQWQRPAGFVRKTWDVATTIGAAAHWGDWRGALGLTEAGEALLERTCALLAERLHAFGTEPQRFGLIHADLRLANLLIEGDRIALIDFDDCGFGWFMFDFAAAISFHETDPAIPALQAAWVAGYRNVAELSAADEAEIPTMIMLRRLQLTAWIASHSETPTAEEMGAAFTDATIEIAKRYLAEAG